MDDDQWVKERARKAVQFRDERPCDCIEQYNGVFCARCYCDNFSDAGDAATWCAEANALPAIEAALSEAITRTREAERALAAEALKLALQMQVEAIERERTISKMEAEVAAVPVDEQEAMKAKARSLAALKAEANHFDMGRESVIARLKNPDEALIEAVGTYLVNSPTEVSVTWDSLHPEIRDGYAYEARGVIRALAAILDKEEKRK